ncbi:hypothetical protein B5864_16705 [Salmonella enterica]|uniref:DUF5406 domain-containing protein n=2 Tax=Salmonella enterica TaxID=28901 RepID=A0A403T1V3_SALER|nr:DUF5406 family protein [Salmonella sp. SG203]EAB7739666.1 hypothetical protein [Salmonella enterica subsp. enterica serovar Hadar]EAV6572676.1 hypothetical protein [Salmonella enterica]EBQ9004614.1 hypothetical protein [Salmonella enterica subsp. enterica serovar Blockley]EBR8259060.1 hypothetical protein [Salmonella enterica subsp. enterica serovar Cerro]EBW7251888.1 hypothetical protein [Salmonella enterica subsp. enterica serovar Gatow]EBX7468986.1 hypothetical protein [Salmonella enter
MSVAENLTEEAVLTDFNPNMMACGRAVKQTVRLTFGCWRYRGTFEFEVGGNITGLDAIRYAVEILYESLPSVVVKDGNRECDMEMVTIELDGITCADDDLRGVEWLADMLVSAEIIRYEPDGTL